MKRRVTFRKHFWTRQTILYGDDIVRTKTMLIIIVALAFATALAAAALPAASKDTTSTAGMSAADMSDLAGMVMPKAVMFTVEAGSTAGGNLTYAMPYAARVQSLGDKDIAIVATYNRPLMKTVNISTGTGVISIEDALPATATIDYANRSSIPVAGANAVVVLQQFEISGVAMENDDINFQVGSINVYLPDGTTKAMKLDKPVRMSMSLDRMKMRVDASPALASKVAELFENGATFPADATPARLNDILAAI